MWQSYTFIVHIANAMLTGQYVIQNHEWLKVARSIAKCEEKYVHGLVILENSVFVLVAVFHHIYFSTTCIVFLCYTLNAFISLKMVM